jgi:GntR family transcriptional repressor for pyruvate dehydrogenase complex
MSVGLKGIVIESAPKQIARRIREAILEGTIEADERLPTEDELARQFGVSRSTVREALKRLAAENLVESRRGASGGNFVRTLSYADIKNSIAAAITVGVSFNLFSFEDFAGTRLQLTQACCQVAAQMRSEADLAVMREEIALQRSNQITDVEFCASDVRYHCQIASATCNPLLAASAAGILEGLEPIMNLLLFRFRAREAIADQHERIVTALEARDSERAVAVLKEQTKYLIKTMRLAKRSHRMKDRDSNKAIARP